MTANFARYVLLKKIAVGGMAEIFLARRLSVGGFAKFVVIKRLLPEHRSHKAYEQLFLSEGRITALLNHPNIIDVYDLDRVDDAYFIAMEYVHGASAAEMMALAAKKRVRVPLAVALHIVRSTAEALNYCEVTPDLDGEPLRVLHHDVSPHNIQIGFNGAVKLLDFGVATRMKDDAPGGRRGKYAYMSPEAIAKGELTPRSDQYALAVCMFELTLGRRLFKGRTPEETKARATAGEIPRPTDINPKYPPAIEAVLLRALSRDPKDRFPTGRAFADAIALAARGMGIAMSMRHTRRWMEALHGEEVLAHRFKELQKLAVASTPQREDGSTAPPEPETSGVELRTVAPAEERTPTPETTQSSLRTPDISLARSQMAKADANALVRDEAEISVLPVGVNDGDDDDWDLFVEAPIAKWRRRAMLIGFVGLLAAGGAYYAGQEMGRAADESRLGVVRVESDPPQARVYDGRKLLGMTPFTTKPSPMGTVLNLRISKPDYVDWTSTISITPARRNRTVMVALRKARK